MSIVELVLIIFILYIFLSKSKMKAGGSGCPDGYVQARCMGPNGEKVCTPHPADPSKSTIYI